MAGKAPQQQQLLPGQIIAQQAAQQQQERMMAQQQQLMQNQSNNNKVSQSTNLYRLAMGNPVSSNANFKIKPLGTFVVPCNAADLSLAFLLGRLAVALVIAPDPISNHRESEFFKSIKDIQQNLGQLLFG